MGFFPRGTQERGRNSSGKQAISARATKVLPCIFFFLKQSQKFGSIYQDEMFSEVKGETTSCIDLDYLTEMTRLIPLIEQ